MPDLIQSYQMLATTLLPIAEMKGKDGCGGHPHIGKATWRLPLNTLNTEEKN